MNKQSIAPVPHTLSRYETPISVEAAVALLDAYGERARLVAGGTDLLLEMARGERPLIDVLIDVTRIEGLGEIRESSEGRASDSVIHIGPLVTHNQVVRSELIVAGALPLAQACLEVASPQIRNRATLAGNLVTGSPAGDVCCALEALGAQVVVRSAKGLRTCAVAELRALRQGEMLVDIAVPRMRPDQRGIFAKLRVRQGQAIAIVSGTILVTLGRDNRIESAAIALGSFGPRTIRAASAELFLSGAFLNEQAIGEAANLASREGEPIDDIHAGAAYRRDMTRVLVRRALRAVRDGAERSRWPDRPPVLWGRVPDGRSPSGSRYQASHGPDTLIEATVNGRAVRRAGAGDQSLLQWLRDQPGLSGTKDGCGEGVCGACTVTLDGLAVLACLVPAARAHGAQIRTVEGLAREGSLQAIQTGFLECGAVQCGFCTPGFVMAGATLLDEQSSPTREQVHAAFAGNLCRCTGYYAIEAAVQQAAQHLAKERPRDDREV